jgi:hypothetical protein
MKALAESGHTRSTSPEIILLDDDRPGVEVEGLPSEEALRSGKAVVLCISPRKRRSIEDFLSTRFSDITVLSSTRHISVLVVHCAWLTGCYLLHPIRCRRNDFLWIVRRQTSGRSSLRKLLVSLYASGQEPAS